MSVEQLATLLRERRALDERIAKITGRNADRDDIGRSLARDVFGVVFAGDADGNFSGGPLAGKRVGVHWYGPKDSSIDISGEPVDYVLIFRGGEDAWSIAEVCLFDVDALRQRLRARGTPPGPVVGVRQTDFEEARIFPTHASRLLPLSAEQRQKLSLFAR
jgi:hypothetical protein